MTRLTDAERVQRNISEADWQSQVLDLARLLGWRTAHFRAALTSRGWRTAVQGDGAGFPDVVLTRGARCIVAELKTETSKLTDAQAAWLAAFAAAGIEAFTWRPRDLDAVVAVLRARNTTPTSKEGSQ